MNGRMELRVEGRSEPFVVEVRPVGEEPERFAAVVDGEEQAVEIIACGGNGGRMLVDGRVVPFFFDVDGSTVEVWVAGRTHRIECESRRAARGRTGRAAAGAASGEVTAPMPGTILQVLVKAGDDAAAHQALVVMESMKMEMTLSSPVAGRVERVACQPGELVSMGALLVKMAQAGDGEGRG